MIKKDDLTGLYYEITALRRTRPSRLHYMVSIFLTSEASSKIYQIGPNDDMRSRSFAEFFLKEYLKMVEKIIKREN